MSHHSRSVQFSKSFATPPSHSSFTAKAALTDRVWWRLFASPKWKANRPMKLLNSFRWLRNFPYLLSKTNAMDKSFWEYVEAHRSSRQSRQLTKAAGPARSN